MSLQGKVVRTSVVIFYLLIGLEIIIMISPFAAYFYAGYGPLLNVLYAFPATAWLTGFFLPHAVVSKSSVLNFVNGMGRTLFSLGILAFLIGAFQVYSAKFRRKGVVTGILYRWIRHPQYLFLAIAGLGLLLFWPRFFILILYVSWSAHPCFSRVSRALKFFVLCLVGSVRKGWRWGWLMCSPWCSLLREPLVYTVIQFPKHR
jgi:protein-S-isoprenylcysteine O-methyltransferase Ste14